MIFPSRSQLASKQITQTLRSGAIAEEGIDATLLQHVSPIEWDNVSLYGQYVLDRALVRFLMLYFNTNVGATLLSTIPPQSTFSRYGSV